MPRKPQRSDRWSLRQVSLAAGVSLATARAVVRNGHLDPLALTAKDVIVLRVAAMLPALQPLGELRPANAPRPIPARELEAIDLIRNAAPELPAAATLVVTADGATLARTIAEASGATMQPITDGDPFLSLPVGKWALELRSTGTQEAA